VVLPSSGFAGFHEAFFIIFVGKCMNFKKFLTFFFLFITFLLPLQMISSFVCF